MIFADADSDREGVDTESEEDYIFNGGEPDSESNEQAEG